jgi:hypothetical protein
MFLSTLTLPALTKIPTAFWALWAVVTSAMIHLRITPPALKMTAMAVPVVPPTFFMISPSNVVVLAPDATSNSVNPFVPPPSIVTAVLPFPGSTPS